MKSNHVVSLEIAKQMKAAGWKKETKFYWVPDGNLNDPLAKFYVEWELEYADNLISINGISAPLATEILEEISNDSITEYTNSKAMLDSEYLTESYRKRQTIVDVLIDLLRNTDEIAKMWIFLNSDSKLSND
jgi:hypothetical protein